MKARHNKMKDQKDHTVRTALQEASLKLAGYGTSWLDASLLLAHVLGCTREKILASFPDELALSHKKAFERLVHKRAEGFPVAWLTGKKEFYARDFIVREGILCPRPDTEILVEEALKAIRSKGYKRVHDLCTGSGCIALTLALETGSVDCDVSASDISPVAQALFEENRLALGVKNARFSLGPGLSGAAFEGKVDLIVSNPPYLTREETRIRMEAGWKEPPEALDGGDEGLDLIREIIAQSPDYLKRDGMLMLEADPRQMGRIRALMTDLFFEDICCARDLAGDERVIKGVLR